MTLNPGNYQLTVKTCVIKVHVTIFLKAIEIYFRKNI